MINEVRAYLALPEKEQVKQLGQLELLHSSITGEKTKCVGCNFYAMQRVLTNYLNQNTTMAKSTKYTWSKDTKVKQIADSRYKYGTITPETLTDETGEAFLKATGKDYVHIIQLGKETAEPKTETKTTEKAPAKKTEGTK